MAFSFFSKKTNTTLLAVFLLLLSCSAESQQKNILFIAVDDLKPLLNSYGHGYMHTPNFDRLAASGIQFTNAHVQQAVCGPSRASVMTGTFPDQTRVWDLHTDFREVAPSLISMPEYLIQNGFISEAIGKIYHYDSSSPNHDGKSWTAPHYVQPDNYQAAYGLAPFAYWMDSGFSFKKDSLMAEAASQGIDNPEKQLEYAVKAYRNSTECLDVNDDAYLDGLYAKEACARLHRLKNSPQPFFLALGFIKPHLPFNAPKKYWDLYQRDSIDLAAFRGLSEGTPKVAYHSFGEIRAYSDIDNSLDVGREMEEDKQRELIHGYMACVSYIDAQLGKVLDALNETGLTKNTYIVLWGDHGYHLGDHTIWCKHSNFEQATHIPLLFSGPDINAGQSTNHPVELLDVFPTLFDLVDLPIPAQAEGHSLRPLFDKDSNTVLPKDYAMSQYPRGPKIMGYSVRDKRYRYTEWRHFADGFALRDSADGGKTIAVELYDYDKDPNESKNLVEEENYQDIRSDLKLRLEEHLNR